VCVCACLLSAVHVNKRVWLCGCGFGFGGLLNDEVHEQGIGNVVQTVEAQILLSEVVKMMRCMSKG